MPRGGREEGTDKADVMTVEEDMANGEDGPGVPPGESPGKWKEEDDVVDDSNTEEQVEMLEESST